MLPSRILLIDRQAPLVSAWAEAFASHDRVEPIQGDLFDHPADALVSPANSFGIMDGGLDRAIRDVLGFSVEKRAQRAIVDHHHGELPVGSAEIVPSDEPRWPWMVVAPTMRIPEVVGQTLNAYLAFRAALVAILQHNRANPSKPIQSVVCPGLATGIGAMEPRRCAAQMRVALQQLELPARIPSAKQIHEVHRALRLA
jgi:O-acetyl-ADP-ribose deacetylase (regulator of RNase III)